jgi:nitrite reductase/ring-hydroxylating ferredoxin subunit
MSAPSTETAGSRTNWVDVGAEREFPRGEFKIIELGGRSIGVLNATNDRWYAVRNICPHRRAPVCFGSVSGTYVPSEPDVFVWGLEGRVLRCPWHSYEYDVETGRPLFMDVKERLIRYEVLVVDGRVHVSSRAIKSTDDDGPLLQEETK